MFYWYNISVSDYVKDGNKLSEKRN